MLQCDAKGMPGDCYFSHVSVPWKGQSDVTKRTPPVFPAEWPVQMSFGEKKHRILLFFLLFFLYDAIV